MMSAESNSGFKYFTKNFQGSNVSFDAIKEELYGILGDFTGKSKTELAQKIKEYCLGPVNKI